MTQQPGDPWTVLFTSPDSDEAGGGAAAIDPTTDIYYAATNQGTIYAAQSGENWQLSSLIQTVGPDVWIWSSIRMTRRLCLLRFGQA